jgi:hypothetical protein
MFARKRFRSPFTQDRRRMLRARRLPPGRRHPAEMRISPAEFAQRNCPWRTKLRSAGSIRSPNSNPKPTQNNNHSTLFTAIFHSFNQATTPANSLKLHFKKIS